MSYLARETASLPAKLWSRIDSAVSDAARQTLISRRFLHLFGPLGAGTDSVAIDNADTLAEVATDGLVTTAGRKIVEIPTIYDDFTLFAKDLEASEHNGVAVDVSRAAAAAERCARKEDKLILLGDASLGYEGLLTAKGINKIKRSDWSAGENAFSDITSGLALFAKEGLYGPYALLLSPDLFAGLHRIQPGTGILEIDRLRTLVNGHIYQTPLLDGEIKAALLDTSERNMDLAVGLDLSVAYLEQSNLNHVFRVLETAIARLKRPGAVIVFE